MAKYFRTGLRRCAWLSLAGCLALGVSVASAQKAVTVLALPFEISSPEQLDYLRSSLADLLSSRIGQSGEVHVFDPAKVKELLGGRSPLALAPEEMTDAARKAGARYILLGRFTKIGDPWSIDAALFDPFTGQVVGRFSAEGESVNQVIPKAGELAENIRKRLVLFAAAPPPPPPKLEFGGPSGSASLPPSRTEPERAGPTTLGRPWVSPPIRIEVRSIALGDVNGDGRNEIIVLGRTEVQVYQWDSRTGIRLLASHATDSLHELLTVDAADLNGNRLAELYVTAKTPEAASSLVLEWNGRGLATITDRFPWYLRVVDQPGQGQMLLGQRSSSSAFPEGAIQRLTWRGRDLAPVDTLPLAQNIPVTSLALGDLGDGRKAVFVDRRNQLLVYDLGTRRLALGATDLGQTNVVLDSRGPDTESASFYLPGRVLIDEIGPQRQKVVIAAQNQERFSFLNRLRFFVGGEVVGLGWQNEELAELWRTERRGFAADFQVGRLVPRGEKMLVVGSVMAFSGVIATPESRLAIYSMSGLSRGKR